MEFLVNSEEETAAIAARLAQRLRCGDLVCLSGDLGAGKTTLIRGIVAALNPPARVSSPTFTLVHEYTGGRLPVAHMDAYRLSGFTEFCEAGLNDYLNSAEWVVLLEWPERLWEPLPRASWRITLSETGPESRKITVEEPA